MERVKCINVSPKGNLSYRTWNQKKITMRKGRKILSKIIFSICRYNFVVCTTPPPLLKVLKIMQYFFGFHMVHCDSVTRYKKIFKKKKNSNSSVNFKILNKFGVRESDNGFPRGAKWAVNPPPSSPSLKMKKLSSVTFTLNSIPKPLKIHCFLNETSQFDLLRLKNTIFLISPLLPSGFYI